MVSIKGPLWINRRWQWRERRKPGDDSPPAWQSPPLSLEVCERIQVMGWRLENRLYTHYGVQPTQVSFIHYAKLKKKQDESPLAYFERLCHHSRSHLAPSGATPTANGIVNKEDDTMTKIDQISPESRSTRLAEKSIFGGRSRDRICQWTQAGTQLLTARSRWRYLNEIRESK